MFTLEMMNSMYDNCRHKAVSYFKKIANSANTFICYNNLIARGNTDGVYSQQQQQQQQQQEMPCQKDIEEEFDNFIKTLNLLDHNCDAMKNLSLDKKWNILQERKNCTHFFIKHPRQYVALLNNEIQLNDQRINGLSPETISALETLHISIRTQCQNYVEEFIEAEGIKCLTDLLTTFQWRSISVHDNTVSLILNIIKSVLNTKIGKSAVMNDSNLLKTLVLLSGTNFGKEKMLVMQILAGICLLENGSEKVLASFNEAYSILGEHCQFQRLIWQLTEKFYPEKLDLSLKIATMSFINVLLNSNEAKNNIEQRLRLRKQFLALGLEKIMVSLRQYEHPVLQDHLDLFEMMKLEDEQNFLKHLNEPQFDATSPTAIAEVLESRLKIDHTNFSSFLSIMQSFTLIPADKQLGQLIWKLCNAFIENLVFQTIRDNDSENVHQIVSNQLTETRNIIESELEGNGYNHEQVIRITEQINKTESCLKEVIKNNLVEKQTTETVLPKPVSESSPKNTSENLCNLSNSPSNSQTVVQQIYASTKMAIVHPLPSQTPVTAPPPTPPPLPPPLTSKSIPTLSKSPLKQSNHLKGLNWIAMPRTQLEGTVWSDFKTDEIDQLLDVELLDKNFSVQSKNKRDSLAEGGLSKCLSVLEPRRAQNFQILLTKLKLPNEEISHLITTLDANNLLHKDMIEQMLKFIPTKEEIQKLNDIEISSHLNQVDHFFLLSTKIPRYEQRLKCLWISKVFKEKSADLKVQVEAVIKASNILRASKRVKKLLQMILAVGNRMNDGKHNGDAKAFHISSLVNLTDVKSSLKPDYTLLHYLVDCCESKFPEVFRLKRELLATTEASKVSSSEIESELNTLRTSLNLVENELSQKEMDNIFVTKMTSFLHDSLTNLSDVQVLVKEMNSSYKSCLQTFAITSTTKAMNPGEFFGLFSRFLSSLLNIRRSMKQEKENQEKRMETLSKARIKNAATTATKMSKFDDHSLHNAQGNLAFSGRFRCNNKSSDFEHLISALQNGDMFLDDLQRLRSSFRRNPQQPRKNRASKSIDRTERESRER